MTRGDTLNTPTITLEASSPAPDTILLNAYHWKAQKSSLAGPEYEKFPDVDVKKLVRFFLRRLHRMAPDASYLDCQ